MTLSHKSTVLIHIVLLCCAALAADQQETDEGRSFQLSSLCGESNDFFQCIKVRALKMTNNILSKPSFKLIDGVQLVSTNDVSSRRMSRSSASMDVSKMTPKEIDAALLENANEILSSEKLQFDVPRLLSSGLEDGKRMIEARGKKYKKYLGPFVAALAIKGGILTMVYHSIAIIAGKNLKYVLSAPFIYYFL